MSLLGRLRGLLGRLSRKGEERGERDASPSGPPPDLEKKIREIEELMNDEKRQNAKNLAAIRAEIEGGPDVDRLPDASGEFGRDLDNPIPVNGSFGEMIYLSMLRSTDAGARLTFHRRGSKDGRHGPVEIYETVTLDGKKWDVLFLAPHHPRKSRQAPEGYRLADPEPPFFMYGVDHRVARFPDDMARAVAETTESMLGVPLPPPEIGQAMEKARFKRPREQSERVAAALEGANEVEVAPAASFGDGIPALVPAPGGGLMPGPGAPPGMMSGLGSGPAPASRPKKKRKPKPKPQARRRKKKKKRRRK